MRRRGKFLILRLSCLAKITPFFKLKKIQMKVKTISGDRCHVRIFMVQAIIFATDLRTHFLRSLTGITDEQ